MGATVALLVAGKRPDLVRGLALADPVILSHDIYRWMNTAAVQPVHDAQRDVETGAEAAAQF